MIHWMTSPATTAKKQTKKNSFRTAPSAGAVINGDYYHHVYIRGLDYILCDDCLEEDPVDDYYNSNKYGY